MEEMSYLQKDIIKYSFFCIFITLLVSCKTSSLNTPIINTFPSPSFTSSPSQTNIPTNTYTPTRTNTITPTSSPTPVYNFSRINQSNLSNIQLITNTTLSNRNYVYAAAWSKDNKTIAVTLDSGIFLFDAANGKKKGIIPSSKPVYAIDFSPDSKYLAYGDGHSLIIFDISSNKITTTLYGHSKTIRTVTYNKDGTLLASGGDDSLVILWDVNSQKQIYTLRSHTAEVLGLSFTPDGGRLASAGMDGTIIIWDLGHGTNKLTIDTGGYGIHGITFIKNGESLVSGGEDGQIKFWDPETGNLLQQEAGHTGMVLTLAADPSDNNLAWAGLDGLIYIQSISDLSSYKTIMAHDGYIQQISFDQEGTRIVSTGSDYSAYVWNAQTYSKIFPLVKGGFSPAPNANDDIVRDAIYSPNGDRLLLTTGYPTNKLFVWDRSTDSLRRIYYGSIANALINNSGMVIISHPWSYPISLLDISSTDIKDFIPSGQYYYYHQYGNIAASKNGKYLAWAWTMQDNMSILPNPKIIFHITIAAMSNESIVSQLDIPQQDFANSPLCINEIALSFNPSKEDELMVSTPKQLILYDASNGKETTAISTPVNRIVFSPDGNTALTTMVISNNCYLLPTNRFAIWKVEGDNSLVRVTSIPGSDMSYNPDGTILAVVLNGEIQLLNTDDWSNLRALSVPGETMTMVRFDPDGTNIVSISKKGKVWLWGINS